MRVWGLEFEVRVWGLGFGVRVWGLESGVRVWGLGFGGWIAGAAYKPPGGEGLQGCLDHKNPLPPP